MIELIGVRNSCAMLSITSAWESSTGADSGSGIDRARRFWAWASDSFIVRICVWAWIS